MKTYSISEIETLIIEIDRNLKSIFEIIIIGGAAAALAYKVQEYTRDIDTIGNTKDIEEAYQKAVKTTGLQIPLGPAAVYDTPYNYSDRLVEHKIVGTKYLKIFVPEKHDLVLMKIMRGQEHDLHMIEEMGKTQGLDFKTLIERFTKEMTHVHGNKSMIYLNFLAAIERLFGEKIAEKAKHSINK